MAFIVPSAHRVQSPVIEKAWKALSSFSLAQKEYLRPGITAPVARNTTDSSSLSNLPISKEVGKVIWASSDQTKNHAGGLMNVHLQTKSYLNKSHLTDHESSCDANTSLYSSTIAPSIFTIGTNSGAVNVGGRCLEEEFVDALDDDEMLKDIDVDQIVMDHYLATGTPKSSDQNSSPFTPFADNNGNIKIYADDSLPVELSLVCKHGFKVALCPEAMIHLQDMKERLIAVSNQLLDNASELSLEELQKLRQERLELNKQIQQLDKYLRSPTRDDERQRSHYMASTPTANYQSDNPPGGSIMRDQHGSDAQQYVPNNFQSSEKWFSSSGSFSLVERLGTSSCPVERELFTLSFDEITYVEGSNDMKWNSRDFPWTRELEVLY